MDQTTRPGDTPSQFGLIRPQVVGSCPLVGEACALDLIRELEEHKLRNLKESTRSTQKCLWGGGGCGIKKGHGHGTSRSS